MLVANAAGEQVAAVPIADETIDVRRTERHRRTDILNNDLLRRTHNRYDRIDNVTMKEAWGLVAANNPLYNRHRLAVRAQYMI
jgi:predicted metal-dependent hydrolase